MSFSPHGALPRFPRRYLRITRPMFIVMVVLAVTSLGLFPSSQRVQAAVAGPDLAIDVSADRHTISPDIYGMNDYAIDPALADELNIPVQRRGGNHTTRYNWKADTSNSGFDWYFMSGGNTNPTPSGEVDHYITGAQNAGADKIIVTIPVISSIDKGGARDCSYPVSIYGPQQSVNPYEHPNGDDCGNSLRPDGSQITNTTVDRNHIANTVNHQREWVQHLVNKYGTAANGGVKIYELDNEPSGWGNTHRDVYTGSPGYDELINQSIPYAEAIKDVDPSAMIDGPGDFGWAAYVGMGKPGDNAESHGIGFAEYYLQRMQAYEQQTGRRLLDYFDEHYYPSSYDKCIALCPAGDAATQAERLQSTRSLWDPTYDDNSWIGQWYDPIRLVPRFHEWVNANYPGTKTSITEYNWGGLESINGALTQADVLGIFGRERLDLATMWGPPTASQPGAYAFRMYLNYDGNGGKYGDTWIRSTSADQGKLAVYGAQRSSDGALTLMIINKTGEDLTSNLSLAGTTPGSSAQVYTYSGANLNAIVRQADQTVGSNGFSRTYAANSMTMVVIPTTSTPPAGSVLTGTNIHDGGGAWSGCSSCTANKAFDNNTGTYYDAATGTGAWTGIDLGSSQTGTVSSLKFYPRSGWTSRMVGGKFQGSNNLASWTDLHTVNSTPPENQWTTVSVSSSTGYRYLRYLSAGSGSYGNVAEVQFIGIASGGSGNGLKGDYYNSVDLGGSIVFTNTDGTVNFDWGNGTPASGVNADNFSVRWTGKVQAPTSGNYTFTTESDDGIRLWVNGQLVIDNWTDHPPTINNSAAISLTGGQKYDIKLEFYERGGGAVAKLLWTPPGGSQGVIPQGALFVS